MLDFEVALEPGMHTMELFGGEGCCDGKTNWKVNGVNLSVAEMESW